MAHETVLLGATNDGNPQVDSGNRYAELRHTQQKLHTINHRWNPNTLAYEVETVSSGTGSDVNVTNASIAVTGPLTDTQLRASAVPVSLSGNIAQETGGNLASIKTNTDPLVAAGAGGYVRQDSTATI